MRVSVIIPVYNVAEYLPMCLDSLDKGIGNISAEVILVNDGSTDDSEKICAQYAETHSNATLINKHNGGLSDARNVGLSVSKGKYIYFLDSDDWLEPGAIELLYNVAEARHCELVQAGYYYSFHSYNLVDKRFLTDEIKVVNNQVAMRMLLEQALIKNFAWGKLYKRELIENLPFPKGLYFEDSFWQHKVIAKVTKYGIVNTPLYNYRQRDSSISGIFSEKNFDLLKGNIERYSFIKRNYPQFTNVAARSLNNLFWEFYGQTKKNSILLSKFNQLLQKYRSEFPEANDSKTFILSNCRVLYNPILLLQRISAHFAKNNFCKSCKI